MDNARLKTSQTAENKWLGVLGFKGDIYATSLSSPRHRGQYKRGKAGGRIWKPETKEECWESVFWMWECLCAHLLSVTMVTHTRFAFSTFLQGSVKGSSGPTLLYGLRTEILGVKQGASPYNDGATDKRACSSCLCRVIILNHWTTPPLKATNSA